MTRIFNDMLQADDCSGLYTLMGLAGGQWQEIYTIAGPMSGSIEVDAALHTIAVDTSVFIPGQAYLFKWVDSSGTASNVRAIYIPAVLLNEDGSDMLNEMSGLILLEN